VFKKGENEFPHGIINRDEIPTQVICACEKGHMDDDVNIISKSSKDHTPWLCYVRYVRRLGLSINDQ
jgi:hypothetical protein